MHNNIFGFWTILSYRIFLKYSQFFQFIGIGNGCFSYTHYIKLINSQYYTLEYKNKIYILEDKFTFFGHRQNNIRNYKIPINTKNVMSSSMSIDE